jgi:hypothetical protein
MSGPPLAALATGQAVAPAPVVEGARPTPRGPGSGDAVAAAQSTWSEVLRANEKLVKLAKLQNIGQIRRNRELWQGTWRWRLVAVSVLTGIVIFFVKTIRGSVTPYPTLGTWWTEAHTDDARYLRPGVAVPFARNAAGGILTTAQGEVTPGTGQGKASGITMRQLATVIDREPIAVLANLTLAWKSLSRKGALFLRACIQHFEDDNAQTRRWMGTPGRLNLLHFQGQLTDYMPAGWTPDRMLDNQARAGGGSAVITQESLWSSWHESAMHGNIWYDLLPQTAEGLAEVPLMSRLIGTTAGSNVAAEMDFRTLVDGGLVNVAMLETSQGESVNELLGKYFGSLPQGMAVDCTARKTDGAINGAIGMGMVAPGFIGLLSAPVLLGLTGVSAAVGYVVGGAASEEECRASTSRRAKHRPRA